ncbi:hypothetical protein BABINDRAFT_160889 [Babjeviella inositovora NRRL Y-12698]|uniref:Uncharacterized protein n=1 Tax=Babjeviella inositovora NRRL Y-12698 TaxID=984486 RepID=A0A1E3QSH1_9ASCO|nr:uncharacterized protein BABINDRAFT_160889 [Babjeviella inositovora NRRL Y-12698]ODQ80639.1 hypothetical protein BABINDRAFT_160889 [Babjeviella inositovora NRRL Y-12698]
MAKYSQALMSDESELPVTRSEVASAHNDLLYSAETENTRLTSAPEPPADFREPTPTESDEGVHREPSKLVLSFNKKRILSNRRVDTSDESDSDFDKEYQDEEYQDEEYQDEEYQDEDHHSEKEIEESNSVPPVTPNHSEYTTEVSAPVAPDTPVLAVPIINVSHDDSYDGTSVPIPGIKVEHYEDVCPDATHTSDVTVHDTAYPSQPDSIPDINSSPVIPVTHSTFDEESDEEAYYNTGAYLVETEESSPTKASTMARKPPAKLVLSLDEDRMGSTISETPEYDISHSEESKDDFQKNFNSALHGSYDDDSALAGDQDANSALHDDYDQNATYNTYDYDAESLSDSRYSFESENHAYDSELVATKEVSRSSVATTDSQARNDMLFDSDDDIADIQEVLASADVTPSLETRPGKSATMTRIDDLLYDIENFTMDSTEMALREAGSISTDGVYESIEPSPVEPLSFGEGPFRNSSPSLDPRVHTPPSNPLATVSTPSLDPRELVSRASTVRKPPPAIKILQGELPLSMISPALSETSLKSQDYSNIASAMDDYLDGQSIAESRLSRNSSSGSLSTGRLSLSSSRPRDSMISDLKVPGVEPEAFDTFSNSLRPNLNRNSTTNTLGTMNFGGWNPDTGVYRDAFMLNNGDESVISAMSRSSSMKSQGSTKTIDGDMALAMKPTTLLGHNSKNMSATSEGGKKSQRYSSLLADMELPDETPLAEKVRTASVATTTSVSTAASNTSTTSGYDSTFLGDHPRMNSVVSSATEHSSIVAYKPSQAAYNLPQILSISNNQELKLKKLREALAIETAVNTGLGDWLTCAMRNDHGSKTTDLAIGKFASEAFKNANITEIHRTHTLITPSNIKQKLASGTSDIRGKVGEKGSNFAKGLFSKTKKIMRSN